VDRKSQPPVLGSYSRDRVQGIPHLGYNASFFFIFFPTRPFRSRIERKTAENLASSVARQGRRRCHRPPAVLGLDFFENETGASRPNPFADNPPRRQCSSTKKPPRGGRLQFG
jgi:hypothetical protein